MDLAAQTQDLYPPAPEDGPPAPGRRARQTLPQYAHTRIHHLLYLHHCKLPS